MKNNLKIANAAALITTFGLYSENHFSTAYGSVRSSSILHTVNNEPPSFCSPKPYFSNFLNIAEPTIPLWLDTKILLEALIF